MLELFLSLALRIDHVHASQVEDRLFCSALLSTALKRAPVPSLASEEVRKAIYALAGFARVNLPPPIKPNARDDREISLISEDRSARPRLRAAGRVRRLLDEYGSHDGTVFVAAVIHGADACTTFAADLARAENPLLARYLPNCVTTAGGRDAGSVRDFLTPADQTRADAGPHRWLLTSERHRLRAALLNQLLRLRSLDAEMVEHELGIEREVAEDTFLEKAQRWRLTLGSGQDWATVRSYLYDEREVLIDRLFAFGRDGVPEWTVVIRVRQPAPSARSLLRSAGETSPAEAPLKPKYAFVVIDH